MSASTAAPPQPVPTIDDARAVAEALMSFEQVCEVAVFGSVARAAARPDSDLDLLVVCDDIDYGAQRAALAVRMREIAASVVRWPLDLLVTDRAAWAAWTGLPSTSEAVIAEDAITLQQRPATGPVSRKIVPMSTAAENAASSLERVTSRLRAALQVCAASTEEKQARRAGDEAELNDARMSRWCNTLTECDMVLEHALTSINHSLGGKGAGKTHHLAAIFREAARRRCPLHCRRSIGTITSGAHPYRHVGQRRRCLRTRIHRLPDIRRLRQLHAQGGNRSSCGGDIHPGSRPQVPAKLAPQCPKSLSQRPSRCQPRHTQPTTSQNV